MAQRVQAVVPLRRDAPGRFLPWIFALMVYLAALSLIGVIVLHMAVERWQRGEVGTLTVQLLPVEGMSEQTRIERLREVLADMDGISRIHVVPHAESIALIEQWLGDGNLPEDLPLPRLIDLELRPGHGLDAHALEIRLQDSLSNVTVDDTKLWIDRLADLGRSLELLALTVFALILCAVIVTVIFTTRMGISIHRNVIELLHLIGAQDGFIAAQFQRQAMMMGLRGGVIGIVFAVATVYGLLHVFKRLETPLVPDIPAEHWTWVLLTAVPIAMAGIAMLTARLTALRELAKLP